MTGAPAIGAAAAVLFAVNVTAALPVTPSNLGVFQAACVAGLSAYGVGKTDALAYGIILQAVEIATALAMGMPALVREGMTWKDLRVRALHASPVQLRGLRRRGEAAEAEAQNEICRPSRKKPLVGPSSGRVASHTTPLAPSSTGLLAPNWLPMSVATTLWAGVHLDAVALELGGEDARHRVQRRLRYAIAWRPAAHLVDRAHAARHVHDARVFAATAVTTRSRAGRRRRSWCPALAGSRRSQLGARHAGKS